MIQTKIMFMMKKKKKTMVIWMNIYGLCTMTMMYDDNDDIEKTMKMTMYIK